MADPLNARIYRMLLRIRRAEEEVARIYPTDKIKSPVHLSIGQEAISTGVCLAMRPDDAVFGTYRGHALYLAKGGDLKKLLAELYGKVTGCGKGKGGSMHLIDPRAGIMGTSAVVATTIPQAVGYAMALKYRKRDSIVGCFFGDGATEEGVFFESLNFALLRKLPVLFVCENNGFSVNTPLKVRQVPVSILDRVRAWGIPVEKIEGNDVLALHERVEKAIPAIRSGGGPRFFECMTYRWREHVGPNEDYDFGFRTRSEAEPWIKGDQVARLGALVGSPARNEIEREVEAEIQAAIEFAEKSPFPPAEELTRDVYGA